MRFAFLAGAAALAAATALPAQSLKPDQVFSSIAVHTISNPDPVLGADDRVHLAYELMVSNPSPLFVTLDSVEAVDSDGKLLSSLSGDRLGEMMKSFSGAGTRLAPGEMALVVMDVTFASGARLPQSVAARISATRQAVGPGGRPVAMPSGGPIPPTVTFTAAAVPVGRPARVIAPPLRGKRWVVVNGCCDSITSHRGAVMTVNGAIRVPERFAIDFVQLDPASRLFTGPKEKLSSYAYYGAPVLAVADGTVVNLYDRSDEQVPGEPPVGVTPPSIGGNMVVVDIGGGAFAFYAHMQRGSLKVKLGDRVKSGQLLGLVGNTGNTDAPHLHFQLMDSSSPLDAVSLPFVLRRFSSEGSLVSSDEIDSMLDGKVVKIDPGRLGGVHSNQLPLNRQVVGFE